MLIIRPLFAEENLSWCITIFSEGKIYLSQAEVFILANLKKMEILEFYFQQVKKQIHNNK